MTDTGKQEVVYRLEKLRAKMKVQKIFACLILMSDPHGFEYVGEHFQVLRFFSGFTGSAGVLLVTETQAGLLVDGRYVIQAKEELDGTGIKLYQQGQQGKRKLFVMLKELLQEGRVIGVDGRCISYGEAMELREWLQERQCSLSLAFRPAEGIWLDRPQRCSRPIWLLEEKYTGEARFAKLARVRETLGAEEQETYLVLSSLTEIAWLLNLRGNDVAYTPVALAYLILGRETCFLYLQKGVEGQAKATLQQDGVCIREYEKFYEELTELGQKQVRIYLDWEKTNAKLVSCLEQGSARLMGRRNVTELFQATKNSVEQGQLRQTHIQDGVALTRMIYRLKNGLAGGTELEIARELRELRGEQPGFLMESFSPIVAYGDHGAIVHYRPTKKSNRKLERHGFLLLDTGGQYLGGTTDVTRTISMGALTEVQKEHYTAVLRGHINLAMAVFPEGTYGFQLDSMAREPLWEKGLDYLHNTGHGVGYVLCVHERAIGFQKPSGKGKEESLPLTAGMVLSDEPGYYLEGAYGIRLENLLLCTPKEKTEYGTFLQFETLTVAPFDREAILWEALSEKQAKWLQAYQQRVYEILAPLLSEEEREWLQKETFPLEK